MEKQEIIDACGELGVRRQPVVHPLDRERLPKHHVGLEGDEGVEERLTRF
jgi:hypothetical protein